MTKLKIDLRSGILEVEGEETFVREIYEDYKEKMSKEDFKPLEESTAIDHEDRVPTKKRQSAEGGTKKNSKRKESYQIVKDLDLSAKGDKEALKDFYKKKLPKTAMQKNTLFVYYLEKIAKIKGVTVDHIYTCYKGVNEKVPGALRQSLVDTAYNKGWIDTKSMESITVATHGENLVEHDLPSAKEKK